MGIPVRHKSGTSLSSMLYHLVRYSIRAVRGRLPNCLALPQAIFSWSACSDVTSADFASCLHEASVLSRLVLISSGLPDWLSRASRWSFLRDSEVPKGWLSVRASCRCLFADWSPSGMSWFLFPYPGCLPASNMLSRLALLSAFIGHVLLGGRPRVLNRALHDLWDPLELLFDTTFRL